MDISWRFKRQNGKCQPHRWFWSIDVIFTHSIVSKWCKLTLHKTAAPAVLEAIKSELSYRNDMMITFSSQLTKLKTELKLVCPLLILNYRIPGLIWWGKAFFFLENKVTIILSDDTRWATSCHAGRRRPIFGAKLDSWRHKIFHIFHFFQFDKVLGFLNPFSWVLNPICS